MKPLAESLPSFIKDTTHLINKIDEVNQLGPFPTGTLLVSWDVVAMFPNIDNELGVTAVKNALDARSVKIPSTECILEAVEICLESKNCQFDNNNYVQQHGTAMGPKNACSYADLAMGVIDHKAKFEGTIKAMLWLRYIGMIFLIYGHRVLRNSLNLPTILIHYIIPSNLNWFILKTALHKLYDSYTCKPLFHDSYDS